MTREEIRAELAPSDERPGYLRDGYHLEWTLIRRQHDYPGGTWRLRKLLVWPWDLLLTGHTKQKWE